MASTTPTHSMPSTRGKVTPSARPRRVCSSDRLRPNASTLMRTHPDSGSGSGSWRICRFSTRPGALSTTALMLDAIQNLWQFSLEVADRVADRIFACSADDGSLAAIRRRKQWPTMYYRCGNRNAGQDQTGTDGERQVITAGQRRIEACTSNEQIPDSQLSKSLPAPPGQARRQPERWCSLGPTRAHRPPLNYPT